MKKHLPITILIAVGILAILVVGYSYYQFQVEQKTFDWQKFAFVSKSTDIDTSDWLTYRNEKYGFEFKYPRGWEVPQTSRINDDKNFSISFSRNDTKVNIQGSEVYGFISSGTTDGNIGFLKKILQNDLSDLKEFPIINGKAYYFVGENPSHEKQPGFYLVGNKNLFNLFVAWNTDQSLRSESLIKEIVSTFKFIN